MVRPRGCEHLLPLRPGPVQARATEAFRLLARSFTEIYAQARGARWPPAARSRLPGEASLSLVHGRAVSQVHLFFCDPPHLGAVPLQLGSVLPRGQLGHVSPPLCWLLGTRVPTAGVIGWAGIGARSPQCVPSRQL